jgi:frataxin
MDFDAAAAAAIARLAEAIEDLDPAIDVDVSGGVLRIDCPDGRCFVINKHGPNRQIWLSSPISGAGHFAPDGDGWRSTRADITLDRQLAEDLAVVLGRPVMLA